MEVGEGHEGHTSVGGGWRGWRLWRRFYFLSMCDARTHGNDKGGGAKAPPAPPRRRRRDGEVLKCNGGGSLNGTCTHLWAGNVKNRQTCHVWRHCRRCGGWQYVRPGRRSTPDWVGHPPGFEAGEYKLVPVERGVGAVERDGGAVEQGVERGVERGVEQDGGAVERGVLERGRRRGRLPRPAGGTVH